MTACKRARLALAFVTLLQTVHAGGTFQTPFPVVSGGSAAAVWVAEDDWKVARIAAGDVAADIERVSGTKPQVLHDPSALPAQVIVIGTLGKSPLIDRLVKEGRLDVSDVAGLWESFVIQVVDKPTTGIDRALVIAGSDRRGTAYGAYELSRRIGVSPWYWWADVTPQRNAEISFPSERIRVGPPKVKYRGIFINDEMWGIRPWAEGTLAPSEGRGLGPTTYAKVCELLLRLRANHLWPAMHLHTTPFNSYPENKQVADDYAIVMGSSHIEPMLRNNMTHAEWDREHGGEWNYQTNRDAIQRYWERRIMENGRFENIYTLGMRGKDDEPMHGGFTPPQQIELLEKIFADQRAILSRHISPDIAKIPQVFIPYTEVLGLYDKGLKVPDDVTICWPDDNFGYIRRLPQDAESKRPGGSGVYYHIQWINGATTAYPWLNTMPPALIFTEMYKAWQHGADRLWVLNVGDIKPGELGMEFFLDMAWNPDRWLHGDLRSFFTEWAARDIDPKFAGAVADIMEEYFRLGFIRRPEHLLQSSRGGNLQFSWFSHDHHGDEAATRLARYDAIAQRAEAIHRALPADRKAAFFQLVLYPVKGSALMNRKIIHADKNRLDAEMGRASATTHARIAREAAEEIKKLDDHYNHHLTGVGDKWRYMMTSTPGPWGEQRHQFHMPPLSDFAGGGPPELEVAPEGGQPDVCADISIYTRNQRFIDLFNHGKGEITWRAKSKQPWLRINPSSGSFTDKQRLWVDTDWQTASAGNEPTASITFESNAGSSTIQVPVFAPAAPSRNDLQGFVESHGCVSMEAEHATRFVKRSDAAWSVVDGLGRHGDSVTVLPATVESRTDPKSITTHSPSMEFDFHVFHTGTFELHLDCLPTHPVSPGRGTRIAVSCDSEEPAIATVQETGKSGPLLSNLRRWKIQLPIKTSGRHTLKVWMVDPGVILDRVVLHTTAPVDSCLGPPESYHK